MISKEAKIEILNEILESAEFYSSETYKNLLTYLVRSSIDNKQPKEYSIALEVFKKDADFNPSEDSTVRVYVGKLRKKLDNYYKNEGKKHKVRIEIPKGHYEIRFFSVTPERTRDLIFNSKFIQYFIIFFLLIIVIYSQIMLYTFRRSVGHKHLQIVNHPLWANIINSESQKLFVLGDDFFFIETSNEEETILRKHNINTIEELENYKRQHPDRNIIGQTPYPFIPLISIKPFLKILPLFKSDYKISIQYSSNLKSSELLNNEIIFIGSFRNLFILNQAFKDIIQSSQLGYGTNILKLNLPDSTITLTINGDPATEHTDYCLVRKIPGPNHNTIILFTSFFITGITGATDYMTNPEKLDEIDNIFREKYGDTPQYFDILFRTTGFSRTAFTTQIEYVNKIDPKAITW